MNINQSCFILFFASALIGCGDDDNYSLQDKPQSELSLYEHQESFTLPSILRITNNGRIFRCGTVTITDELGTLSSNVNTYNVESNTATYCSLPHMPESLQLPATIEIMYEEWNRSGEIREVHTEVYDYESNVLAVPASPARTYSNPEVFHEQTAETQPYKAAVYDISGAGIAISHIVKSKFDSEYTELEVIDGLFEHGNEEQITERRGFSLLDIKQFISSIGYYAAGFAVPLDETFESAELAAEIPFIAPFNIFDHKAFYTVTHIDENNLIVVHPFMGHIQIPMSELLNGSILTSNDLVIMLISDEAFTQPES